MNNSIYNQILEHFKGYGTSGKSNLARALKITPAAIDLWDGKIPEGRAYQIEVLTEGKFRAKDILDEQKET